MNITTRFTIVTLLLFAVFTSNTLAWKVPGDATKKKSTAASAAADPFKRGLRGMRKVSLDDFSDTKGTTPKLNRLVGKKVPAANEAAERLNQRLKKIGADVRITRTQVDKKGNRHIRMKQYCDNMPVIGSDMIVHVNTDNEIYLVSGNIFPIKATRPLKGLGSEKAKSMAIKSFPSEPVKTEGNAQLVVFDSIVAYECTVVQSSPPQRWKVFLDARTGTELGRLDQLFRAAPGPSGSHVPVTGYRLPNEDGALITIKGWQDLGGNYFLYHKNELWGVYNLDTPDWEQRSTSTWGTSDPASVSLANNFSITQNFVASVLGRSSFNDLGAFAQANVHEGTNYVNAYWDGSDFHFGDGDGVQAAPLTTLDISAHEYGHAITQYTSNLVYSYESGALNESFSDIMGTWVEFHAQPDGRSAYPNATAGQADWLCGEDCWLDDVALRDLRDPQRYGNPSYYMGTYWYTGSGDNGGVHYNSGVQNHAFYLLAEGGSGSNDGHPYNLTGMGVDTAGEIAMYANMYLLTSSSQYRDARNGWIQAAVSLGYDADRVSDAWAAVGILPLVHHLDVSPSSLAFDSVGIGVPDTMVLNLINDGGDATLVSSLNFSNPAFSAITTLPFSVPGGSTLPLRVVFNPVGYGYVSGSLTINSDAEDNPVITVPVEGTGVNPAAITITPQSFNKTVAVGDSTSAIMTITNTGEAMLHWTVSSTDVTVTPVAPVQYDMNHFLPLEKGVEDSRVGEPVTTLYGGPDSTGYTWIDSDDPAGPTYQWQDISTSGTRMSTVSGCDDCYQAQPLSFSFPFYGNTFDTLFVSSNGYITFGTGSSQITNYPLPSTSAPANLIDALHDDLYPSSGGDIYFEDYGNRVIVQFTNVYPISGSGSYTFQIVLEQSGTIYLYYDNLTGPLTGATIGIQNGTRDDGLTVAYNTSYLKNGLAVKFSLGGTWLSVSPESGNIPSGQSAAIQVKFNGSSVPGGTYFGQLDLSHNAPATPSPQTVPCTLWVDGIRRLSVAPTSVDFGPLRAGSEGTAVLTVTNSGDEATVVSSVTSSNSVFSGTTSLPLTVPPFGSSELTVSYSPQTIGSHSGTLTINSNAEDNPALTVALAGTAVPAPQIEVTPASISVTLDAGNSTEDSLLIRNTGGDTLSFSFAGISGGSVVINEFCNSPDFIELWNRGGEQDMSGWSISWIDNTSTSGSFTFPSGYVLGGGKRVVLRESTGTNNDSTFYWGSNIGWVTSSVVSVSLYNDVGTGVDFVRTTGSTATPPAGVNFYGTGVAFSTYSAYRLRNDDTDSTTDWANSSTPSEFLLNPGQTGGIVMPSWLQLSATSGKVATGDSARITVSFHSGALVGGTYNQTLSVTHNATNIPSPVEIPVGLTVNGFKRLAVTPSSLSFGAIWVGLSDTVMLTLSNSGNEATQVSSIASSNGVYSISGSLPVTVPAFGEVSVPVIFQPGTIGSHSGTLTITSDAEDNPTIAITCTGTGTTAPEISVTPLSFSETLDAGDSTTAAMTIENSGGDTLRYHLTTNASGSPLALAMQNYLLPGTICSIPENSDGIPESEKVSVQTGPLELLAADLTGITIIYDRYHGERDSSYESVLINDIQTRGAKVLVNNQPITASLLDTIDILWIDDDGTASFSASESLAVVTWITNGGGLFTHCDAPGFFQNIVQPFGITFGGSYTSGYTTNITAHPVTDSVSQVYLSGPMTACLVSGDAQIIVRDTGNNGHACIAEAGAGRIVCVADDDFYNTYMTYADNRKFGNNIIDWLAGGGTNSWLSADPDSGVVPPSSTITHTVRFRTGDLLGGDYTGTIDITHDDPSVPSPYSIPCSLTVDGIRRLSVSPTSLDFGSIWVGLQDTMVLLLSNSGNEATQVSSITSNNGMYSISGSLPLTVPAFDEVSVPVIFQPGTIGSHSGTLTITSDAEDNPSITVSLAGEGTTPPVAEIRPDSLYYNLQPSSPPETRSVFIHNTGGGLLQYTVQGANQISGPGQSSTTAMPQLPNIRHDLIYSNDTTEHPFIPGRIIIGMSPSYTAPSQSILDAVGAVKYRELGIARNPRTGLQVNTQRKAFLVTLKDTSAAGVSIAIGQLRNNPAIAYAEPDYIVQAIATPNDPYFSQLYGMNNTGQTGGTADADIDATEVWDRHTGTRSILVGIIDTGIDYLHPDLAANIWTNPGEIPDNGIDDDGNGYIDDVHGWDFAYDDDDPTDGHYHGTHCAGTIAGIGDNGIGVAGVMWTANLVALKFLDDGGSGATSDAIDAVNYATAMGISITSNSWGGGAFSQSLMDAIALGGLFVAAAGNDGINNDASPHYPSSYELDNILAVAATDDDDLLASFSCYGLTSVDIGAPGVDIYSCSPGSSYRYLSGTSMATPHVSGAAGLVLSYNPSLTALQLKDILMESVDPVASLSGITVTGGRLNVNEALDAAGPSWLSVSPLQSGSIVPGDSVELTVEVTPSGLEGGRWTGEVIVITDDPLHQQLSVSVTADIDGQRSLTVTPSSLEFSSLWIGLSETLEMTLTNSGNEATVVSSISSDNAVFNPAVSLPVTVGPGSNVTVPVVFSPVSLGAHTATITITSNAEDNPSLAVNATGSGLTPPSIAITPDQLSVTTEPGQSTQRDITIGNTGGDVLDYSIHIAGQGGNGDTIDILAWTPYTDMSGEWNNMLSAFSQYLTDYSVTTTTTFDTIQLESALESREVFLIPEQESGTIASGTGTVFRGFLTRFLQRGGTIIYCCPGWSGNTSVFLSEADLMQLTSTGSSSSGTITLTQPGDSLFSGISGTFSMVNATSHCQVNDTSEVLAAYNGNMVVGRRMLYSGQVITLGSDYYTNDANWARILCNSVLGTTPSASWISLSSQDGSVPTGGQQQITVTLNAIDLDTGTYNATLSIAHNDPLEMTPLQIPVTLRVSPTGPREYQGGILSIGTSSMPFVAGTRFRIVDLNIGSAVAGQVQGTRYTAILR